MHDLTLIDLNAVSGGELVCSAGFPSGIKCEGGLSDWKQAAVDGWNFLADIPGTAPWVVTKILEK